MPEEAAQPINIQITSHVTMTCNYRIIVHTKEERLNERTQVEITSQRSVASLAEAKFPCYSQVALTLKQIHL